MYIGSTGSRGVGHLVNEILDNSTDEGVAGYATRVEVTLHADGSVQVDDDGRGIPTDTHAKSGMSGVELVLTRLHAGGKFGGSGYKTSGGLHGVGASAVNALSHRFDVSVKRAGKLHQMSFPHGVIDMVDYLTPAADKPVCATLVITGEGRYKENAADENGVMQSNVERRAEIEIALRWGTGYERTVECFTNTIRNVHGGTHRKGFERAVVRALTDAIRNTRGLLRPKEEPPVLDDMVEGVTAVVHVRIPEPQFTSQTK